MTIDTLLADVSPLLPVGTANGLLATGSGDYAYHLAVGEHDKLSCYMRHAANHLPAMLAALREIADLPSVDLDMATVIAKQAIAAASELTPQT